jgi:hypothetical protein
MSLSPSVALPPSRLSPGDGQRADNVLRFDPPFYVGAALRLGRRPLSPEALDRLSKSLKRLAAAGDATAPVALAWLLQKQAALVEGH